MANLFKEFSVRNFKFNNRIVMAPMCMDYGNEDGTIREWHYIHYVSRAMTGLGLMLIEATAVEKRGRTLNKDIGLWNNKQMEGLKSIVYKSKESGCAIGIQLSHCGRKSLLTSEDIIAPSAIPFIKGSHSPREMTLKDINEVIDCFREAAYRANIVGFDVIEIHGAHGYLINQFLSPLTNHRKDHYGGTVENRVRFLSDIIKAIREVWPKEKPLILRISAEEYDEKGNHPKDLADLINLLDKDLLDIIDVSSGGVTPTPVYSFPGYQVIFAEEIKRLTGMPVIGGGLIKDPFIAEEIISNNRADLIYIGRELLRDPNWIYRASELLKAKAQYSSVSYEKAWEKNLD
ncbi:NADPH dehydrogenase [Clostridium amazonitimonense]|uniref:oxidoreductase n=1 Tax=Clostridium amazonitimonense TaxID=1499689 RepID=UPI000509A74E|nr:NADPH dehydrogenase [Clostridium amazonitimonense]